MQLRYGELCLLSVVPRIVLVQMNTKIMLVVLFCEGGRCWFVESLWWGVASWCGEERGGDALVECWVVGCGRSMVVVLVAVGWYVGGLVLLRDGQSE